MALYEHGVRLACIWSLRGGTEEGGPGRGREGEGVQTLKVMVLVFGRSTLRQDNDGYGVMRGSHIT